MSENVLVKRNAKIDLSRLFFAICVIAIHTHPFQDVSDITFYIFTETIPRVAVPFFFCVMGYYFIDRLKKGKSAKAYFKGMLITYSVWSLIFAIINMIIYLSEKMPFNEILITLVKGYFFYGTNEHLWFFPAAFISMFVIYVFYKLKIHNLLIPIGLVVYAVTVISTAYSNVILPSLGNLDYNTLRTLGVALPFMSIGILLNNLNSKKINKLASISLIIIFAVIYFAEKFAFYYNDFGRNSVNVFSLYFLVLFVVKFLLDNPESRLDKYLNITRRMSGLIYYFHPVVMAIVNFITNLFIKSEHQTLVFLLTTFLSILITKYICKYNNKITKLFF